MIIYNNCDDLPIYFFYKIFDTKDYRYLIIDFNKYSESHVINEQQQKELSDVFNRITFEYSRLTNNNKLKKKYQLQIDIKELEIEYNYCVKTIEIYLKYEVIEVLLLLEEFGYDIDVNKDIKKQILRINNQLKGIKNKVRLRKIRYTKLYKEDKDESNDSKDTFLMKDLEKKAIYLKANLNISIDTKKTSVTTWASILDVNEEKRLKDGQTRIKNQRRSRRR